jgi:hypothetical protein
VIPDGREAIWDNDGAAGLEAMVLRDGVLVGFVPQIPDSDDLPASAVTEIIANADYDAPVSTRPATPSPPPVSPSPQRPASAPAPASRSRWRDRLRRP